MKTRSFRISLGTQEHNFSGLCSHRSIHIADCELVPTVENIRSQIKQCFPCFEIDERWATLFEQIHSDLFECGMFSVDLLLKKEAVNNYPPEFGKLYRDEFFSYSAEFDEKL